MKVFKFGGASVKDANGVRNLKKVLDRYASEKLVVVVSAMGKMTNAFEQFLNAWIDGGDCETKFEEIAGFHRGIAESLQEEFPSLDTEGMEKFLSEISHLINSEASSEYDFQYDRLVSYGELLSTSLVEAYLKACGIDSEWMDVRHIIRSNSKYRQAEVDWARSGKLAEVLVDHLKQTGRRVVLTQGFIAADEYGNTTTLGREGSDYTGAILAYLLDADSLTIWKDVPGMLNADPR